MTGRTWFVGLVLAVLSCANAVAADMAEAPAVRVDEQSVSIITQDGRPLLEYAYGGVSYKPYVRRLFSPKGLNVLLDSPPDHIHHHGLMYAIRVDDQGFWEEANDPGRQAHLGFSGVWSARRGDSICPGFSEDLEWMTSSDGAKLLDERRTLEACIAEGSEATLVTWRTELKAAEGRESVSLGGSHYYGLGMRFIREMDKTGVFFNPSDGEGELVRGDERLYRAKWCAYTVEADGRPVTVAMFDHPDNARHPAWWFTMKEAFAYMSATLNLYREPLVLAGGQTLNLKYGVAVWDEAASAEKIEPMYEKWLELSK